MTAHQLRVGQLVSASDPATLADLCPTYTRRSTHAIVVAVDEHQVAVKWIDYRGLQRETCFLEPSLLRAGTLNAAARTRVIHCRRTDPLCRARHQPRCRATPNPLSRSANSGSSRRDPARPAPA